MSMWWQKGFEFLHLPTHQKRTSRFIDREFQVRFGGVVVIAATLGALLGFIPISIFLNQNYRIFIDLAHQYAPHLMESLEREQIWVLSLLFVGFSGLTTSFLFLSFRLTNRIVGPLKVMRNHLRRMSRGQWSMAPVRIRDNDEFHDLVNAYNYFYESFRGQIRRDLETLKQIRPPIEDKRAYDIWSKLVEEKCLQLNLKSELPFPVLTALNAEWSAQSPEKRHVS